MKQKTKKVKFVQSKITGGHYAFQTEKASKPFQNPMGVCMSIQIKKSDIVADVGAYVGEFSLLCARQGAKKVYAFEPTPDTFKLLKRNAKQYDCITPVRRAVVGDGSDEVTLYISTGIGVTNSIVKEKQKGIKVKTVQYERAVKKATVVKIDVEGAEYSFDIIQPDLRAIILEFHPLTNCDWQKKAKKIIRKIRQAGFEPIHEPEFKHGWDLIGSWTRKLKRRKV